MGMLQLSCGFTATASNNGTLSIFNTSNIQGSGSQFDPDLGSPNQGCNPSGPGRGAGGAPNSSFANCEPQGNALIIQDPRYNYPNDNVDGGCIVLDFFREIELVNMILLDVEEPNVTIKVCSVMDIHANIVSICKY
jgi:hypothetical protein